jgi:hypothetical protein
MEKKKYGKYGVYHPVIDGIKFQSKKEADRYGMLKLLQRAGKISDLKLQVSFALDVHGTHICNYIADFTYLDRSGFVVEDVKGVKTRVYNIKKKLMLALYNIKIKET